MHRAPSEPPPSIQSFSPADELLHDIRSPLTVVLGALQELQETANDVDRSLLLELALRKAHEVLDLANDVLDASVPQRPDHARTVDLSQLVRAVVQGVRHQGRAPTLRVVAIAEEGVLVEGNRRDLGRAVANLVENAAAHARGLVAVTVSLEGNRAQIAVDDDGDGIPPQLAGRLFRPWTTSRPGGTGLGLAIVHRIVRAHGGSVEAFDRPEGGARFVVRLPSDRSARISGVIRTSPCDSGSDRG